MHQAAHDTDLSIVGLFENRMENRDYRHTDQRQQRQQVLPGRSAEDAELMLDDQAIRALIIDEGRGIDVRAEIMLANAPHHRTAAQRGVAGFSHRDHRDFRGRIEFQQGFYRIARECRDAAFARRVAPKHDHFSCPDRRLWFLVGHEKSFQ